MEGPLDGRSRHRVERASHELRDGRPATVDRGRSGKLTLRWRVLRD